MESAKPRNFNPISDMKTFGDDDPLPLNPNPQSSKSFFSNYYSSSPFHINAKGIQQTLKLSQEYSELPVLISLRSKDPFLLDNGESSNQSYIDLILVIDHSGSMEGLKMRMVKQTLKQLLQFLRVNDRVSIVIFDDKALRLTPLLRITPENKIILNSAIDYIEPEGGTSIHLGIEFALEILSRRKFKNNISSIMLLSDGLDDDSLPLITECLAKINIDEQFSIHTFGYGADHDPICMSQIAQLKAGNFYFIENSNIVDDCFVDCLGSLLSIVAVNAEIEFEIIQSPIFKDLIKISKIFGEGKISEDGTRLLLKIPYMVAGAKKDYVIILRIPKLNIYLKDHEKNIDLAKVFLTCDKLKEKNYNNIQAEKILLKNSFLVTILNPDEELKDYEKDEEVEINYLRVISAENMEAARIIADKGNLNEGLAKIDYALKMAQESKRKNHPDIVQLSNNLEQAQLFMAPKKYQEKGQHFLVCNSNAAYKQQSHPIYSEERFNGMQERMISITRKNKK